MIPGFELKVPPSPISKRIDVYLVEALDRRFSRAQIKAAIEKNEIFLNGKPVKPKSFVKEGDVIRGGVLERKENFLSPENISLDVIYEDEDILVVNKPTGMVVHPGAGNKKSTLVHALLGRQGALSDVGGLMRPGIVHRLDKGTSGILVVAKHNQAHRLLQAQFSSRNLSKTYIALVQGRVEFQQGHILEPIGRHPKIKTKMAVRRAEGQGREAESLYRVLKRFAYATLLEVKILTGRTHQIRVHMAHLGYPVVGDEMYGKKNEGQRLALHASKIEFTHPKSGKIVQFTSELPDDFKKMIEENEKR